MIPKISHCVSFAVLGKANSKKSKGLCTTGIGSVSCARHEMYRPNSMGDLQKGERYVALLPLHIFWPAMVFQICKYGLYIFAGLLGITLQLILISYDIACQWGAQLITWMNSPSLPSELRLPASIELQKLVLKFHLPSHTNECQAPFSFNFTPGVGWTDGEGVERNWSILNGIAPSVSQMGPSGRWDTLDDFCNYSNWRKMVVLCEWSTCFIPIGSDIGKRTNTSPKDDSHDSSGHHPSSSAFGIHRKSPTRVWGSTCRVGTWPYPPMPI